MLCRKKLPQSPDLLYITMYLKGINWLNDNHSIWNNLIKKQSDVKLIFSNVWMRSS